MSQPSVIHDMDTVLDNLRQLDAIAARLSEEFKKKIDTMKQGIEVCQSCQAYFDQVADKQK